MIWVWVLIVVVVVAGLIYITINNKKEEKAPLGQEEQVGTSEQNINMNTTTDTKKEDVKNNGLKISILKEGTGVTVKSGDTVSVNYTGTFTNGKAFDSNVDPKFNHVQPFSFKVGAGQVIRGWDEGLVGMKVGEKRKLELAPEYAYGDNVVGPIPANSTLIFEVELLKIN